MSYGEEWIGVVIVAVIPVVVVIPAFALIGLAALMVVAVMALVAVAGAIAATPFLLTRAVRRRWRSAHALPTYTAHALVGKTS